MNNSEIITLLKARKEDYKNDWQKNRLRDTSSFMLGHSLMGAITELGSLIRIFEKEQQRLLDVASQKINIIGEE